MQQIIFLRINSHYTDFLNRFYKKNKNISKISYKEHFRLLLNENFARSNCFENNLKKLGYDSYEIVVNDELLQKKWAMEYKKTFRKNNWFFDLLLAQVEHYKPNVIIWEDPSLLDNSIKKSLESRSDQTIINIGNFCSFYSDLGIFKNFDIVLACSEFQQSLLKKAGVDSVLLRNAFESEILDKIEQKPRLFDLTFIGSVRPQTFFSYRYHLIDYLLKNTPLEIWSLIPSYRTTIEDYFALFYNSIKSQNPYHHLIYNYQKIELNNWKELYPTRVHSPVYGIDMYNVLGQSKITVNCHGDSFITGEHAANMRLFEATGMGALLVTDWKKNISDIFEPDKEVIIYKTPEECVEKIRYYLEHEDERIAIASAGQERTLKEHSYFHRMQELLEIIKKN